MPVSQTIPVHSTRRFNEICNYRWYYGPGTVHVHCKCGAKSPVFAEMTQWELMVDWCNNHWKEKQRENER